MFNAPLGSAIVAGSGTLILGLALSQFAIRRGWIKRTNWLAAATAPLAVATFVYLMLQ